MDASGAAGSAGSYPAVRACAVLRCTVARAYAVLRRGVLRSDGGRSQEAVQVSTGAGLLLPLLPWKPKEVPAPGARVPL
ncbi:hypothetical protein KNE206_60950 [Kitasatospora sp. NE20-6]